REDVAVVVQCPFAREEVPVGEGLLRLERQRRDPQHGNEGVGHDDDVEQRPAGFAACGGRLHCHQRLPPSSLPGAAVPKPFTKTNAMIATVRKMSTAMAEPMPRFNPLIRLL